MKEARQRGEELFSRHSCQIDEIVRRVAAQKRLSADDADELRGQVMLKMVEDHFAVLRGFRGKSRWSTYLTVIVQRVLLDHRVKEWGRWRPCARARRLGPTAIELDRRINRDGMEPAMAVRELATRGVGETVAELERLAARIPRRPQRRFVRDDRLENLPGHARADRRLETAERQRTVADVRAVLASALGELPEPEREMLNLRFGRGWTVRRIAVSRNLEVRPLYRHFERLLRRLRRRLERVGLHWDDVASTFEGLDVELELDLR